MADRSVFQPGPVWTSLACRSVGWAVAATCAIACAVTVVGAPQLATAAIASGWNIVTSPSTSPNPGADDFVLGSTCANAFECWAVGFAISGGTGPSSTGGALIESWNGSAWTLATSPTGAYGLFGVTCVNGADCWAVGATRHATGGGAPNGTLTENWNGTSWSVVASPDPDGTTGAFLRGVSCVSASDCWAVGQTSVATRSAVGVLIEQWNGTAWTVVAGAPSTASYSQLNSVSCSNVSSCWAVGTAGPTQQTSTVPNIPGRAPGDQGLIEEWNGTAWSAVTSFQSSAPTGSYLSGVTCSGSSECWAVGSTTDSAGKVADALMERWTGSSWSVVSSPTPLGAARGLLEGVSCLDATRCWAVGAAGKVQGGTGTGTGTHFRPNGYIENWNGSAWSVQPSPNVTLLSILYAVTCLRGTACWAVGVTATHSEGTNPGLKPIIEQMVLAPATNQGMVLTAQDGGIFAYGTARYDGSMAGRPLSAPIVGVAATADAKGYWEVASDGGIFSFGDAGFYGSMGAKPLNAPVVGVAATADGKGYWEVASDGGIFSFGDATFYGSMGAKPLNAPVVGVAATADAKGYWEVASDGGIFSFGDAGFFGSAGPFHLTHPIVGIATTPDGGGYLLAGSDGGVFTFGNASFLGSVPSQGIVAQAPIVAISLTPDGGGYWLVASDGSVYAYGDAVYLGSPGGTHLAAPVSGAAGT